VAIYLYNTLTRKKEVFKPLAKNKVGFYACGPTVYDYSHIGNFRTYIFEDILRRVLECNGYKIKHVMNFTDVGHLVSDADTGEDKIEKGARRDGKTAKEIADFYIAAFKKDARALNIKTPTVYARATEHIKEQIELVKILEEKGFTYRIYDGLYFDTTKLKDYGQLAQLKAEGLKPGARVANVIGKKHSTDFALWKLTPAGIKRQQEWDSPWGMGFPGWHLECSAMSQKYLGTQFDIHAGAIDLIPIHHTNEIAQSEAAYGKNPARYWLHGEFLLIDGEKMSKSLGGFTKIEDLAKAFPPLAYRYLTLTAHYRSPMNLTWDSLEGARVALNNLYQEIRDLDNATAPLAWQAQKIKHALNLTNKKNREAFKKIDEYGEKFVEAVNDDLDMPKALTVLWEVVGDKTLWPDARKNLLLEFDQVLGLGFGRVRPANVPSKIKKLAQERTSLRQQKNWLKADMLRAKIEQEGWIVEDTEQGSKLIEKKIEIKDNK
jgi:cysteinyl-tRNA synthetase